MFTQRMQQNVHINQQIANNVRDIKLVKSRATIKQLQEQLDQAKAMLSDKSAQATELKALIQGMNEQKNKDIKAADKKNIDAIKKLITQPAMYD